MANTKKYLSHLLQNTGITPACTEEERAAADVLAKIFTDHGFTPEIQEFTARGTDKIVQAALGIMAFVGSVLMGVGGAVGMVGLLLALAAAGLYIAERTGHPILSNLGSGGLSQNVIAYHKASGPLASPRNRPVVVVAHYDSPREDLLTREPFAQYRPLVSKLLPFAMVVPAALAIVRLLPLPDAAKIVLWLLAIVCSLVPLLSAVAIIANRFVLPHTTGSVCNKSSVAAMLGVMDAVAPYELGEEFPHDTPADEYFAEQQRIFEEALAAAQAAAEAEAAAAAAYPHEMEAAAAELDENGEPVLAEAAPGETLTDLDIDLDAVDESPAATGVVAVDPGSTMSMGAALGFPELDPSIDHAADEDGIFEEEPASRVEDLDEAESVQDVEVDEETETEVAFVEDAEAEPEVEDEPEDEAAFRVNAAGNVRFGAAAIAALGMLPASCALVYEDEETKEDVEPTAFEVEHEPIAPFDVDEPEPLDEAEEELVDEVDEVDEGFETVETVEAASEDEQLAVEEPIWNDDEADLEEDLEPVVEEIAEADEIIEEIAPEEAAPEEAASAEPVDPYGETQLFTLDDSPTSTVAMPALPRQDTLDSLMSEIGEVAPARPQRTLNVPSTADAPAPHTPQSANRASLFDLPDPSNAADPFAAHEAPAPRYDQTAADQAAEEARSAFTVIDSSTPAAPAESAFETISAPVPEQEKPRRGLARFFGRKKKKGSDANWADADVSFGGNPNGQSWDEIDEDDGWKGGAAGFDGATEEELREAVANMGDDELLGHDIWFVATGASENGNAGMRAFLDTHRDKLRGVFLINLESVGAGELAVVATEGGNRVLKGDKRIMKLVQRVSSDFHHEFSTVDMPHESTDAHVAMSMSLRSLTIGGVDANGFALTHTEADQPYNLDVDNVAIASDVVTEVIRRS